MTSLTEKEINFKAQQRTVARRNSTRQLVKIDDAFEASPPDNVQAEIISKHLADVRQKLRDLDEIILPNVSKEKMEEEIERLETYQNDILDEITNIEIQLRTLSQGSPPTPTPVVSNHDLAPKLPKLEITKYNGDPLRWDEFWDNYKSCIHDRADLPTIDTFKYLKSRRLADGYRLTVSNYEEVIEALRERFGDPEIATFSHFEALLALTPASYNLVELRTVLDKCESHIRSSTALGLDESTFGVVFTPLILSKLPKGVKIEVHGKTDQHPGGCLTCARC